MMVGNRYVLGSDLKTATFVYYDSFLALRFYLFLFLLLF